MTASSGGPYPPRPFPLDVAQAATRVWLMDRLRMCQTRSSSIGARAVEDAKNAQRGVNESAAKKGEAVPPYVLLELIGKGSYGRVYKGERFQVLWHCYVKVVG